METFDNKSFEKNQVEKAMCVSCNCQVLNELALHKIEIQYDKRAKQEINVEHAISRLFDIPSEHIRINQFREACLCSKCGELLQLAFRAIVNFLEITRHQQLKDHLKKLLQGNDFDDSENEKSTIDGGNSFKCKLCDRQFSKYSGLQKHRSLMHGDTNKRKKLFLKGKDEAIQRKLKGIQESVETIDELDNEEDTNSYRKEEKDVTVELARDKVKIASYSCNICDKKYYRKDYLTLHLRTHSGEKPFSCTTCGKTFSDPRGLDNHVITHSDARPFCCTICGKTFKRLHHLNDHEKNHKDLPRSFKCALCGKGFKFKKHFNSHQLSHQTTKEHRCHVCMKSFSRKDNLQQHLKNVHEKEKKQKIEIN